MPRKKTTRKAKKIAAGTPNVPKEWSLTLKRDYIDATHFGDTNRVYLTGTSVGTTTDAGSFSFNVPIATGSSQNYYYDNPDKQAFDPSDVEWEQLAKLYADDDLLRTLFEKMKEWSEDNDAYRWTLVYDKKGTVSIK